MWHYQLEPRFNDTDALGHIHNASFINWFESARVPIFRIFTPDLDPKKWELIVARQEIDYLAAAYYGTEVTVKSRIKKIGNSSFHLFQEAIQQERVVAQMLTIIVRYDYAGEKSSPLTEEQRSQLQQHLG